MASVIVYPDRVVLCVTIPKNAKDLPARIVRAFVERYGPIPEDAQGQPTMTAVEFAADRVQRFIVETLAWWEGRAADSTAKSAANSDGRGLT